jgi:site-specific DNA recombinase
LLNPSLHPEQPLRAVLYLRQSVSKEESISIELQEAAGREHCRQHGYQVVSVKADPGISGRTFNRPAVREVIDMIEQHQADVIVLWKWSRLSRARLDWAVAVDRVENAGGRIESATEPLDTTTSAGRLARGMLAEFAAFESERIGDVWKETHQRRRKAGLPAQGGPRFGYVKDGDNYTPDPITGPILAELYHRYIAGEGFTRLMGWLQTTGTTNTAGGQWERSRITRLLDSGFGAGLIIHGKGKKASYWPGRHDPVITQEEWVRYLERREEAPPPPRTAEPTYFLSGLIKCGDCGSPMHANYTAGKPIGYICSRYARKRDVRCVTGSRLRAEREVYEWLAELANETETAAQIEARALAHQITAVNDATAIERQLGKLNTKMAALTSRYLDGKVPEAAYLATSPKLQAEHDSLTSRLKDATRRQRRQIDTSVLRPTMDLWPRLTVDERRRFAASVIKEVRVHPPAAGLRGHHNTVKFEIVPRFE